MYPIADNLTTSNRLLKLQQINSYNTTLDYVKSFHLHKMHRKEKEKTSQKEPSTDCWSLNSAFFLQ